MRNSMPLTPAQLAELDFDPPEWECVAGKAAQTAENLENCVVYIREKGGGHYWFYAEGSPHKGVLCGYRRRGRIWRRRCVPVSRIEGYY